MINGKELKSKITPSELLEGIKELVYYSYFYSGVYAMLMTLSDDERTAWLKRVCKKLSRLKSTKHLDERLHDYFKKEVPYAFEDEK